MKFIKYIAVSALLAIGAVSCSEKPVEYTAAEPVGNAEVYFPTGQPTDYDLKAVTGNIEIKVSRVDTDGQLEVPVSFESSNPAFTVPSSVSFAAGQSSSVIEVSVDRSKLQNAVVETVTLTLDNQTTPYGDAQITFTASIPAAWEKLGKGTFTLKWWGEERVVDLYYQDLDEFPDIRYCYLEKGWGPDANNNNYYFYWDTKSNNLYTPMQYTGYTNSSGKEVWYSDAASFYNAYQNWGEVCPSQSYFDWACGWDAKNDFAVPHYDGNGGFYLADWFYIVEDGKPTGNGWQFGGDQDVFILEGFTRTVNYSDDDHFGKAKPVYDGTMFSGYFSTDGGKTPLDFEQTIYCEPYELPEDEKDYPKTLPVTYYLEDFFNAGNCLAFTADAPEILKDGAAISDVENEQNTGLYVFGAPIYVNVKKGSVSMAEGEEFPTFNIQLHVYTKDEEGNVLNDFGITEEVFVAEQKAKTEYTADDLYGIDKKDYIGHFGSIYKDFWDGTECYTVVTIEDAGQSADGAELLAIKGLSDIEGYDDTIIAEWDEGFVYLDTPQTLADFNYKGNIYDVTLKVGSASDQTVATGIPLIIGYVKEDDVFAIIGYPKYPQYSAAIFSSQKAGGAISGSYNWVIGVDAPASARSVMKNSAIRNSVCAPSSVQSAKCKPVSGKAVSASASVKASAKRSFTLSPVVSDRASMEVKNFVDLLK